MNFFWRCGHKVLLLDFRHGVGTGEDSVEHFVFSQGDIREQLRLNQNYSLHAHHFEDRQKRDDHGVARFAGVEESDQRNGLVAGHQPLAEAVHHLRDGYRFVAQFELADFLAAFEDLLESFD